MYTMTQGYKRKSKIDVVVTIVTTLALALFFISSSVKLILNAKFIYNWDIDYLKIAETNNMDKAALKNNYDVLISYVQDKDIQELKLPDFTMSPQGKIHFEEVKVLFNYVDYLFYSTVIISIIGIIILLVKRNYKFLKLTSILMILLPVALAIPFAVDFNATFTAFHNIAFNNDYWLFDPNSDPVINILPEPFFMHMAIGILLLVALFSLLSFLIYRLLNREKSYYDF
ncbi:TIGR01906 family membrane protein [Clostridium thermarum]|uniref:TIGR01906 family membrane protein n=1 Tax=Clostridium thermarum TaxID=1716543 RepID=UPI001FA988FB|nr:TIGR01906 family membrane protein [Clostridium thermarum]